MNLQSKNVQTALNLITGLFTVVIQFAVAFFLSPFIVKNLGVEANGFSQLANNFVMYASLVTIAFNSMASRFITIAYYKNDLQKVREYYSSVFFVNIIICAVLIPLSLLMVLKLKNVIIIDNANINDVKLLFACVFVNFFFNLLTSLYSMAMYVKNMVFYNNILNAIRTLLNAVLLFVVFSVLPVHIFYISAVAAFLTFIMLPIYRRIQFRLLPEITYNRKCISKKAVKDMFYSGIWNTINQCGHLLNTGLDLLLANWFVNPVSMGLLAVSKTIPSAIIQLCTTINSNFSPSITQTWSKGDKALLLKELRNSMRISSILVSVPIVTFCCFGYQFYELWQPSLNTTVLTILSLLGCLSFIPVAGTQTLFNVFTAANRLRVNSLSFIGTGVLNIVCVFLALKYFNSYGVYAIAGISSILSIIRNICIILPYTAYILELKWNEFFKDMGITLLCCLINIFFSLIVMKLFNMMSGWGGLILMIIISMVLTIIGDLFVILNSTERKHLTNLVMSKIH